MYTYTCVHVNTCIYVYNIYIYIYIYPVGKAAFRPAECHRLPNGVRTNGLFYRSAINSHNNAIIMP